MMRRLALLVLSGLAAPLAAQVTPVPSGETPRVQTARWIENQPIKLMALPDTTLTVMLEPDEAIVRVTLIGNSQWDVTVPNQPDTLQITPQSRAEPANLVVETDRRQYDFDLKTGEGLMAAYLVRLDYSLSGTTPAPQIQPQPDPNGIDNLSWSYRVRGDHAVRPATIRDNGRKTVITYAPGQPLPAVFAIGATGKEEVVDGYMRAGAFVIDRVHGELVFRIDKEKATARRNLQQDATP